ncbi:MAG: DNA recombination protein RmuC [Phycisphaerales bacterium]
MDALHIGLLLVALGALGGVVYLLIARGTLLATAAGAEEGVRAAEARAEAAAGELARERGAIEGVRGEVRTLSAEVATLTATAEGLRENHRAEVESIGRRHAQALDAAEALNRERLAALEKAREQIETHIKGSEAKFADVFKALAGKALEGTTEQFLKLATERLSGVATASQAEMDKRKAAVDELLKPIGEALRNTDTTLKGMEKERAAAYSGLLDQVRTMTLSQHELRTETSKLSRALSGSQGKGRYGEVQLRRVAELAGMIEHCDFTMQSTEERAGDGPGKRPDMTVLLPSGRAIAVDAKANIQAYIDAVDAATPEQASEHLDRFATAIARQATDLSRKEYASSAEFVVMFVPSERFIEAALQRRPSLIEDAAALNVILAGPCTLIALLRAVAVGFQEQKISEDAAKLRELAQELHERFAKMLSLMSDVGDAAVSTVSKFNALVGSVESRLLPTLREFEGSGGRSTKTIKDVGQVTIRARTLDPADAAPRLPGMGAS